MTDSTPDYPGSPIQWTRRVVRDGWNDFVSVYYANTTIWRLFKSGALLFLGFFCWSGANLLLSYRADWGFLYYVMAYGFALLLWGPLTHLVIVPAVIRLRRTSRGGVRSWLGRHGSKVNLSVFILIVLLLGTFPPGVMTFEFQMPAGGDDTATVNPQLQCTRSGEAIHCHLSDSRGIDRVVVTSGRSEITTIEDPPFDFDVMTSDLETVNGDKQFTVELQDEEGNTIRRYIRRADLIPG
jgi:hypothetical protein